MAKPQSKAVYHNENGEGKVFDVISQNDDGTVNIGTGTVLVVGKCPISKDGKPGTATLGDKPVEIETPETEQ